MKKIENTALQMIAEASRCPDYGPDMVKSLMKKLDMNEKGFALLMNVAPCPKSSYGMAVPLFHDVQTVDGSGISLYAPGFRRTPEYAIYGGSPEPGYG